jgi:hypothetical protein
LPLYNLPKLLLPVITHDNQLRPAIVLVRLDLQPRFAPARGNWKDICKQVRQLLERCVYLDKDLVLPPMATPGPRQTLFVVASTDMERVQIMSRRIREQLEKMQELKANGEFAITAEAIPMPDTSGGHSLQEQVQAVAEHVTTMTQAEIAKNSGPSRPHDIN